MNLEQIMTASPEDLRAYNKVMVKRAAIRVVAIAAISTVGIVAVEVFSKKLAEKSAKEQD